ncbi:Methanophenazine hydrogenase cytochrome b subunit [Methanosarcina lacustris Z-7289]|uniref:Methanophenazine hydrogenase cytochrome b subunit n=1 Tax=Methanosarcina lacustris Z-7289 TaxID=1434111 RepID=A0A0E3S470_9EURY|nr:cytochrome b [Methanosarcina lacustris]AKB73952.1 Methanophenazine hydrogenase cytochrome b subunit [Methanosarcina lacustris Z-7289]
MVGQKENPDMEDRLVVERYTLLERVTHLVHLLAMLILLVTGLKIYLGWDFMDFDTARALHMIAVPFFLVANWILVPYNLFSCPEMGCSIKGRFDHFIESYIFGVKDAKRLKAIILNFFGRGNYPAFTVYDVKEGHYRTKLHPMFKLLIIIESTAIFFIAVTGVVLYNLYWVLLGLPVAQWIISIAGYFAPYLSVSALGLIRMIHLAAAYWFLLELILHVGILEFDPKVWKYHKAIFWSGKEDLSESHFVRVIEENDNKEF